MPRCLPAQWAVRLAVGLQASLLPVTVRADASSAQGPPDVVNFAPALRTKTAFPENEIALKSRYTTQPGQDEWRAVAEVEKRIGARGVGIVEAVYEDTAERSTIIAVEAGYKHVLHWNANQASILTGALVLRAPTDGEDAVQLNPYLAAGWRLGESTTLQSSARLILPLEHLEDDGETELAAIVQYAPSGRRVRVQPGLELYANAAFESGDRDTVQWSVLPQMRLRLGRTGDIACVVGAELPLNDQRWDERWYLQFLFEFGEDD